MIAGASVANVLDVYLKMVAPEKWRIAERLSRAEHIPRCNLPLSLRDHPMLYPDPASARVRPARNIAGGKDSRNVGLQKFIDQHTIVDSNACFFSKMSVRPHANSNHDEITI